MNKYNIPECKTRNFSFVNLGAALATATCGGYIIITTGLLIAAATGELNGRKTVIISPFFSFFLSVYAIFAIHDEKIRNAFYDLLIPPSSTIII